MTTRFATILKSSNRATEHINSRENSHGGATKRQVGEGGRHSKAGRWIAHGAGRSLRGVLRVALPRTQPSRGYEFSSLCGAEDRKSTRLNSSHVSISYAVFCLKKKNM